MRRPTNSVVWPFEGSPAQKSATPPAAIRYGLSQFTLSDAEPKNRPLGAIWANVRLSENIRLE